MGAASLRRRWDAPDTTGSGWGWGRHGLSIQDRRPPEVKRPVRAARLADATLEAPLAPAMRLGGEAACASRYGTPLA